MFHVSAISARMIDRIFSGAVTRGVAQKEGKMSLRNYSMAPYTPLQFQQSIFRKLDSHTWPLSSMFNP